MPPSAPAAGVKIERGGDKNMKNLINICELCIKAYEPEEINNVKILKEFKGYTIDLRLQQFRKAKFGEELVFIEFDSNEGQQLLAEMHQEVLN